jgi:hypothetical protein
MPGKSIPISVRITPDDASFLAQLKIEGATTPSEKVRGLITEARRQHSSRRTYADSVARLRESLLPTREAVDEAESRLDVHSELLHRVLDWLPDAMARLTTALPEGKDGPDLDELVRVERDLADRAFRLLEALLRMGVTSGCQAYDPKVVDDRLGAVLELADLIQARRRV